MTASTWVLTGTFALSNMWLGMAFVRAEPPALAKFQAVYRVGKTIQASSLVGMTQQQFREMQKALKTEIEVIRPKVSTDNPVEVESLALYSSALDAMLDYDFMRDQEDQLRAYNKTVEAMNPKLAKEAPQSVGLISIRHEEKPEERSDLTDRASAIVQKYQLPTEKRTFNTKWYKGTWVYVSAGWDLRLLGLAADRLSEAATAIEGSPPHEKPNEIRLGMTVAEVETIMGPPKMKADLGEKLVYKYEDLAVEFRDGKVVDVRF